MWGVTLCLTHSHVSSAQNLSSTSGCRHVLFCFFVAITEPNAFNDKSFEQGGASLFPEHLSTQVPKLPAAGFKTALMQAKSWISFGIVLSEETTAVFFFFFFFSGAVWRMGQLQGKHFDQSLSIPAGA